MGVQHVGAERLECGESSPHSKRSAQPMNTQSENAIDEALRRSANGRRLVIERFDRQRVFSQLTSSLERAISSTSPPGERL
jgi:hypothetical protein